MQAYVLTCEERSQECAETVGELARTDWGVPPKLVVDDGVAPRKLQRILDTGRALLARAVDESGSDADVFLFLEDDLTFNRSLRHNLAQWAPVVDRRPDGHLFGSLYNPNVVALDPDGRSALVADPRSFYGSQGMVLSIATARSLLNAWNDGSGPLDLRISRLAARWSPIWYHHPSLVQHRPVASTWGGAQHEAIDFDPEWRA